MLFGKAQPLEKTLNETETLQMAGSRRKTTSSLRPETFGRQSKASKT
ncbi:hypothetical protein J2Y68_003202 [Paenarthrobacter nitroguajacolicus]|nr:hypothetical protein [Paenarthrobacter nitroguajacolicus]